MTKRLFDLVAASVALLLLSPLFVILAAAVKLSSAGPVLYRANRIGRDGRAFGLLKFRSMSAASAGPAITRAGDPRVTAVGRILRRTKLDELPQLINVIRGEMSIVGPRPEDPHYVAMYDEVQRRVLAVRPGITSAASVAYRDEESQLTGDDWERRYVEEIMPAKLRLDLAYVDRASLREDLRIIAATLRALLR